MPSKAPIAARRPIKSATLGANNANGHGLPSTNLRIRIGEKKAPGDWRTPGRSAFTGEVDFAPAFRSACQCGVTPALRRLSEVTRQPKAPSSNQRQFPSIVPSPGNSCKPVHSRLDHLTPIFQKQAGQKQTQFSPLPASIQGRRRGDWLVPP